MSTWDRLGRCTAEADVSIGAQVGQVARCVLTPGHGGPHKGIVLDSDDNAITTRWYSEDAA